MKMFTVQLPVETTGKLRSSCSTSNEMPDVLQEQVCIKLGSTNTRLPLQRAEPSELERVTEKQLRLKCLALSCPSHFFEQDWRHERRGKAEIEKLSNHRSTNDLTTEVITDEKTGGSCPASRDPRHNGWIKMFGLDCCSTHQGHEEGGTREHGKINRQSTPLMNTPNQSSLPSSQHD